LDSLPKAYEKRPADAGLFVSELHVKLRSSNGPVTRNSGPKEKNRKYWGALGFVVLNPWALFITISGLFVRRAFPHKPLQNSNRS